MTKRKPFSYTFKGFQAATLTLETAVQEACKSHQNTLRKLPTTCGDYYWHPMRGEYQKKSTSNKSRNFEMF
jgi:hypothetical protein